jgi:ATP-binding cassette subfamily B protein
LDEPTAALDPKAEYDIFMNFRNITNGKTSILVSHRLSSCIFCDVIIVLENGQILEQGNHEELMKKEGKYKEMFDAQAKYYK